MDTQDGTAQFARALPKVFICHAKRDALKAEELFRFLEAAGADPWLDSQKLVHGDVWEYEIKKAVAEADAFVVCLRPDFDEVGFRQREVRWAIEALDRRPPGRGFIIPFIIEPCRIPDWCKRFHAGSDLTKPTSPDELLRAVGKHCGVSLRASQFRQHLLVLISRIEHIADAAASATSFSELRSLGAQAMGTMTAIKQEFSRHGIPIENPSLLRTIEGYDHSDDVATVREQMQIDLQQAAGYFRSLL